mgnify:CR=1 FL=1
MIKIRPFTDNPYTVLKQSDLFILSSKYEGLPNVLLEALTLKKFKFDFIQFPANIFDQRFLDYNFLNKLKRNN